jgi:alpha/beta superfamily hydrolase
VDVARNLAEFWKTSHVPGELDFWQDLQRAAEIAQQAAPDLPLVLIGYSFGCALLPCVQPRENVAAMVLIAPTLTQHNYDAYHSVSHRLLLVASEDDFATDAKQLEHWFGTLSMPRQLVRRQCDSHFFRGHEAWLVKTIFRFLEDSGR